MGMCMSSPHSAESQEAVEQCMQQIIGHIWAKSLHLHLCNSFPLPCWTSFRPADEQKRQQEKKTTVIYKTVKPDKNVGRRMGGWNLYYSDFSSSYSDFISCLLTSRHTMTHTQERFCLQESARRQTEKILRAMMSPPRFGLPHRIRQTLASIWIQIQSGFSFYVSWAKLD